METVKKLFKNLILEKKQTFRILLAILMVLAGSSHFFADGVYLKIYPPFLPYPATMVYFTGVAEILGGIGLLIPRVSRVAAWGFVLLYIAVYPANINMAVNNIHIDNIPDGNWFQAIRLPFQFVLIAWAWWLTRSQDDLLAKQPNNNVASK
ncbi:MAG: DoxX family protein [Pleurocapsa sp.]